MNYQVDPPTPMRVRGEHVNPMAVPRGTTTLPRRREYGMRFRRVDGLTWPPDEEYA